MALRCAILGLYFLLVQRRCCAFVKLKIDEEIDSWLWQPSTLLHAAPRELEQARDRQDRAALERIAASYNAAAAKQANDAPGAIHVSR